MQRAEIRDAGALAATELTGVADLARDVHRAVAARTFGVLGPVAAPVRLLHDAIAATAYASTDLGLAVVPRIAAFVTARRIVESEQPDARLHAVRSIVNGFRGDAIDAHHPALAAPMRIRTHDGPLRARAANVVHDLAAPTDRIVVFLHGLCENDRSFALNARRNLGEDGVTFGSLLREDEGWTPLYVHYNSGLPIDENGRQFADLLDDVVRRWPTTVTDIALVGHSMGGLVAHAATRNDHAWLPHLRHVVGLGTPHLGAPLERWVDAGTHLLARAPETQPFATWLDRRSTGIKDLRSARDTPQRVGVHYATVSATLSTRPHGRLAHDLLVTHASARGTVHEHAHLGRRHHFDLLTHPQVYRHLRRWLAEPPREDRTP